jgi:orotidine-5'-phosphate decarboxylase
MSADPPARHFGDRLAAAVAERESQIVLGLDPDPARLWPEGAQAGDAASGSAAQRAAAAVRAHCEAAIAAVAEACVAVKPQLACFERLGADGRHALQQVVDCAHAHGLLVLADAKRGDIDVSAAAYAQALVGTTPTPWGEVAGLGVDAFTANPYLGPDTLRPLVDGARAQGSGVFVLVRTSNPGAAELQDLDLAGGTSVWERVAAWVAELGEPGPQSGLSDVCAVTGATAPEHLGRLREAMPTTPFLLPGIGAQGGRVEDVAPAFAPGRAGGLVTSSRGIVGAHERHGGDVAPAEAARTEAERLRATAWGLAP